MTPSRPSADSGFFAHPVRYAQIFGMAFFVKKKYIAPATGKISFLLSERNDNISKFQGVEPSTEAESFDKLGLCP